MIWLDEKEKDQLGFYVEPILRNYILRVGFCAFLKIIRTNKYIQKVYGWRLVYMNIDTRAFESALLQINRNKAREMFEEYYLAGGSFHTLEYLVVQSLENIGKGWENGTISLSQVYMSGVICEELMDKYIPRVEIERIKKPRIAIGVLLDHHALGKRIVYSVLRAGGYEVIDFGQGLSIDEMVEKTIQNQVDILLVSTLMLSSALKVKGLRKKMTEKNYIVKIIVGGAPFRMDCELWKEVGADADGKNASDATQIIKKITEGACQ